MKNDILLIIERLSSEHADAVCELDYTTPYELLVAVILSAQCTDKRVNLVTPKLFKDYNNPYTMANISVSDLIPYIRTCGFFNNKATAIVECARSIVDDFDGQVPNNIDDLMSLRGVGRKTANVVYSVAFGGQAIAVDTHVFRVSNRLGIANSTKVLEVEKQLMQVVPHSEWTRFHHLLIHHGRYTCTARKPNCDNCSVVDLCLANKTM